MKTWSVFLLLSAVSAALQGASPDARGFIRDWLIGGAYPSYLVDGADRGFRDDPLAEKGGEANLRPYEGMRDTALFKADKSKLIAGIGSTNEWGFKEDKTFPVVWKTFTQKGESPVVTLDGRFGPIDDHMIVYAACRIESPETRKIRLRIGSDDDFKAWLNGKLVGSANSSQGVVPDNFLHDAELRRGLNVLVLKVVDRTHGSGFCLAVSDRENRPMTDLVIRTDDPADRQLSRQTRADLPPPDRIHRQAGRLERTGRTAARQLPGRARTDPHGRCKAVFHPRKNLRNPRPRRRLETQCGASETAGRMARKAQGGREEETGADPYRLRT